jgi:hypothetical protein
MWQHLIFGFLVVSCGIFAGRSNGQWRPAPARPLPPAVSPAATVPQSCGVSDDVLATMSAWPMQCAGKLTVCLNSSGLRGLDAAGFRSACEEGLLNCSAVSGLHVSRVEDKSQADIYVAAGTMRPGVLAWCEFPTNSCGNQVQCRFNSAVSWSHDLFLDTLVHELGHGFGLPHTGDKRDIMFASIIPGRDLNGEYGPHYSIPQLVARYGERPVPDFPTLPIPVPNMQGLFQWLLNVALTVLAGYLSGHAVASRSAEARLAELRRAYLTPPPPIDSAPHRPL